MPKYLSNLKHIYQKTYEELKNPNSSIAIFLAGIDKYEFLEKAEDIKKAVKNYITVFETEKDNFREPVVSEERSSYKGEMKRLRKNVEVEKRLSDAVLMMNNALDIFAESFLKKREEYTEQEIKKMTNHQEKLKHQRDRMLNAAYKLEVDLENQMIEKLKAEYRAFDHRPMESSVNIPPFIYNSPHYRIRHVELKGNAKVPSAVHGLLRFRDLLNDHESLIEEAERSRQYETFVNDRLAGHQAWKKTFEMESKVYDEISKSVDEKYFKDYNEFMKDCPVTSTLQGYRAWYAKVNDDILKMESEILRYKNEQKSFDDAYVNLSKEYDELVSKVETKTKEIDDSLQKIEQNPILTAEYYQKNEITKNQAQLQLSDLQSQLDILNEDIRQMDEEQEAAKKAMLERVEQVGHFSDELNKLQDAMETDAKEALRNFLKNYEDGAKGLDDTLKKTLQDFKIWVDIVETHNAKVKETEDAIGDYSKKVEVLRHDIDEVSAEFEEVKNKSEKELKEQKGIGKALARIFSFGDTKVQRKAELEAAKDQDKMVKTYEEQLDMLKHNVETNEKLRDDKQVELKGYKDGWTKIHDDLKVLIQNAYKYTTDIKVKLIDLNAEKERTQLEYEKKIKEIQQDTKEKQRANQEILDKASWDLDTFESRKIKKEIERKQLQDQINEVNKKIEECNQNVKLIEQTKEEKESLLQKKKNLLEESEQKKKGLNDEIETAKYRCAISKQQWQEVELKYGTTIKSHKKMKQFYKEGKVTSNRVLADLSKALTETMQIARQESEKQLEYIKSKEDKLVAGYINKMRNPKLYAQRAQSQMTDIEVNMEEEKEVKTKAGVYDYLKQISSMKKSNSVAFENLKNAVMNQFNQDEEFFMEIASLAGEKREESLNLVKESLKEISDCANTYLKEKGSARRFTQTGKERYRFADEMRTIAETMLSKFELYDKEKADAHKLMQLDDSEIFVTRTIPFYKTESYNMTRYAFVKENELDKMDMMNLGLDLKGDDIEELNEEELNEEEIQNQNIQKEDADKEMELDGGEELNR